DDPGLCRARCHPRRRMRSRPRVDRHVQADRSQPQGPCPRRRRGHRHGAGGARRLNARNEEAAMAETTDIALVTGATRGIGAASARALAAAGNTVVGTATTDEGAAKIAAALAAAGHRGTGLRLDVTDAASVDAAIADVETRFGAITILVNNAGITRDNLLLRMKDEEWDAIMATNLKPA